MYTWEDCMLWCWEDYSKIDNWVDLVDSIVEVFHTLMYFLPMDCWESSIYHKIWPWKYLFLLAVLPDFPLYFENVYIKLKSCLYEFLLYEKTLYSSLIHFTYYYSDRFILISLEWAITLILFTYLGINIQSAFLLRSIKLELDFYLSWQSLPFTCGIATYI